MSKLNNLKVAMNPMEPEQVTMVTGTSTGGFLSNRKVTTDHNILFFLGHLGLFSVLCALQMLCSIDVHKGHTVYL